MKNNLTAELLGQFREAESFQDLHLRDDHSLSDVIIAHCRDILFSLPAGRGLADLLMTYHFPIVVKEGDGPGYKIGPERNSIILVCSGAPVSFPVMAIQLACALRSIELHMPVYRSPEIKDSREWDGTRSEPFDIIWLTCELAHEICHEGKNQDVRDFLIRQDLEDVFSAFEKNYPYKEIESRIFAALARDARS
jgi:hypothetical protein